MRFRYVALLFIACTFATLSPLWTHAQDLPTVIISEISWSGSALSTADEWLELANTSSASVDISSWTLSGASSGTLITIPEETLLEAYETYLIANYAMGNEKSALTIEPDMITSSVSIPNSDLAITLMNSAGETVDSYVDAGSPDFGSTSPYATIERNLSDGTWFTSTPGTPGIIPMIPLETVSLEESVSEEFVAPTSESVPDETDLSTDGASNEEVEDSSVIVLDSEEVEATEESAPEAIVTEEMSSDSVAPEVVDAPQATPDTAVTLESEVVVLIAPITSETITVAIEESSEVEPLSSEEGEINESHEISSVTVVVDYSVLQITEFLSSPSEGSEWVELWNSGSTSLPLDAVTLVDASGKVTALSGTLDASAYLLVENPAGKLNNTGDTITLLLPDGQTLVTLTYGTDTFAAPKKDVSAGVCRDGWHVSLLPSPAQENSCPTTILTSSPSSYDPSTITTDIDSSDAPSGDSPTIQGDLPREESADSPNTSFASVAASVITDAHSSYNYETTTASLPSQAGTTSSVAEKVSSKSTVLSVTLAELDTLASGQHVQITGVLAVAPGIFGKRIAYIHGVQLYFHAAEWPELAPGTFIQVTGIWDVDADSRRIKIADVTDIVLLGTQSITPVPLLDMPLSHTGDLLATASGTLLRKEGDVFLFQTDDGSVFRAEDTANIGVFDDLRGGDVVTVVGMLFASDGTWVLAPRTDSDVVITPVAPLSSPSLSTLSSTELPSPSSSHPVPLIGGGILASGVSALGYWFVRSRKLSLLFSS